MPSEVCQDDLVDWISFERDREVQIAGDGCVVGSGYQLGVDGREDFKKPVESVRTGDDLDAVSSAALNHVAALESLVAREGFRIKVQVGSVERLKALAGIGATNGLNIVSAQGEFVDVNVHVVAGLHFLQCECVCHGLFSPARLRGVKNPARGRASCL